MVSYYKCGRCGAKASFYTFRGVSKDGSYLECYRCHSRDIKKLPDGEVEFDDAP